jgi:hypothetical protein
LPNHENIDLNPQEGVKMRKTWAVVVVLLGSAVAVAGPGSRQGRSRDSFGSDYQSDTGAGTEAAAQDTKPTELLPPPAGQDTGAKPAPPAPAPLLDAPPAPGGCSTCGGCGAAGCHGGCLHKLCAWVSYQPLMHGVNCESCGPCGVGSCCRYHCFPPPYMYFVHPGCVDGACAPPACQSGCASCGSGHAWGNGLWGLFHHGSCCNTAAQ